MNIASISQLVCHRLLAKLEPPAASPPPQFLEYESGECCPRIPQADGHMEYGEVRFPENPLHRHTRALNPHRVPFKSTGSIKWIPGWSCKAEALPLKNLLCLQFNFNYLRSSANLLFSPSAVKQCSYSWQFDWQVLLRVCVDFLCGTVQLFCL